MAAIRVEARDLDFSQTTHVLFKTCPLAFGEHVLGDFHT